MGFAAGFQAGTNAKQGRQALALQRSQSLLKSNANVMEQLAKEASTIAQRGREAGRSKEEIVRSIDPLRKSFERSALDDVRIRAEILGQPMPPESAMSTFNSSLSLFDAGVLSGLSLLTPEEQAQSDATAGVAGTVATAEALTEAGAPTTVGQAAIAAGQAPAPDSPVGADLINVRMPDNTVRSIDANDLAAVDAALNAGGVRTAIAEPRAANVQNFRMPDGSFQGVDANDAEGIQRVLEGGGVRVTLGVQASSLEGLDVGGVSKKELEATKESIQGLNADIEELGVTLDAFVKTPEAGGLSGLLIENIGGLIQQIPVIGEDLAKATGVDPAEVKATRNKARATASRLLTAITKEEGRFTDTERQIATEVLSALTPTASGPQIIAALESATDLVKRSESRELVRFMTASKLDLANPENHTKFIEFLMSQGFTEKRAIDAFLSLEERLGLQ